MSLALRNVSKSFRTNAVLKDVSLSIETGETLVLFGPSGAGKTVLLRLIAGVVEPDAGQILIGGRDMTGVEPEGRGIGMAFQNFALFPHMDAFANIASPLVAQRRDASAVRSGVDAVARLLKIDHVLTHKPKALSNGQKQRTALARALAGQPSTLLLDDPLRNVDAKLRFEMRLELPRLLKSQNATVIYVTQDYKEAMALGQRIAVMDGQGIAQVGTPEDIYLRPATTAIARLFGDPAINLLDVDPIDAGAGAVAKLSDKAVPLPGYRDSAGRAGILGVRPESIRFADAGSPGAIPVRIEAETPLNEKTVTFALTADGREILVSRPSAQPGPSAGTAYLTIDPVGILLFDRATGHRIVPEGRS